MKNKETKIVTCASFGGTGSSVVTDLMKEFSNIKSLGDYEFTIAHEPDGISDLQHYIVDDFHRHKVDEGIYRFRKRTQMLKKQYSVYFGDKFEILTEEYLSKLISFSWKGHWKEHENRFSKFIRNIKYIYPSALKRRINKYIGKNTGYEYVPKFPLMDMNISCVHEDFFQITKNYTNDLVNCLNEENNYEYIALDQLVPAVNIQRYLNYFSNIKVIVVDRDPRDLYILNNLYWKEGWIPSHDVKLFTQWFRSIRNPLLIENEDNSKIMRVRFEDFIFEYDKTIKQIIQFLDIEPSHHINKFKHFNPTISRKNCRLWENEDIDIKLDEIKYIEEALKEFCYIC